MDVPSSPLVAPGSWTPLLADGPAQLAEAPHSHPDPVRLDAPGVPLVGGGRDRPVRCTPERAS